MHYLTIKDLTVRYPFQHTNVLKGVNVSIQKGEKVLILGSSGSGKSTFALTLNGIIPKSIEADMSGKVTVNGKPPHTISFSNISEYVGILFQDPESQFCMLTVEDEILFGLENLGLSREEMESRLVKCLSLVGLSDWRHRELKELSGGMKQKLGLACLIAMDPEVFILDEPTANLDPATTEEMFQLIVNIGQKLNKTLIFIEHKLDQLLPFIDRIIVLGNEGNIIVDNSPRFIFQQHQHELEKLGVWIPTVCKYAYQYERKGITWNRFPLSLNEWEAEWDKMGLITKKQAINHLEQPSKSPSILKIKDLSFSYKQHDCLNNIDLDIQEGDFIAFLGPNGAGKSTLIKLIIGLLKANKGDIHLQGKSITALKSSEIMRRIGIVFQNPEHQFIADTVEHELAYGLTILGWERNAIKEKVDVLLSMFNLLNQRHQNPFSLSQGQKRRLSVATMLTNNQELLILDEPTFGQDFVNTQALMKLLKDLNQEGKTILMITHDMELVYEYANRVFLLDKGTLKYEGSVQTFFDQATLLQESSIKVPISFQMRCFIHAFEEVNASC